MRRSIWFWLLVAVVVVLLLGIMFGGYRKGAKTEPSGNSYQNSSAISTLAA